MTRTRTPKPAMKAKKPKAVKAWGFIGLYAGTDALIPWAYATRRDALADLNLKTPIERKRCVPVLITPLRSRP